MLKMCPSKNKLHVLVTTARDSGLLAFVSDVTVPDFAAPSSKAEVMLNLEQWSEFRLILFNDMRILTEQAMTY